MGEAVLEAGVTAVRRVFGHGRKAVHINKGSSIGVCGQSQEESESR